MRRAMFRRFFACRSTAVHGVDAIVDKAVAAGGKADPGPKQDHGFMYGRSFEDLDGHVFEPMWMDLEAAMAAMGQCAEAA